MHPQKRGTRLKCGDRLPGPCARRMSGSLLRKDEVRTLTWLDELLTVTATSSIARSNRTNDVVETTIASTLEPLSEPLRPLSAQGDLFKLFTCLNQQDSGSRPNFVAIRHLCAERSESFAQLVPV